MRERSFEDSRNASRLEAHIDPVRAEVTFLCRVILRIDEDGIVRARRHARFATDADRFVEIDDAIRAFEHRRGRTGSNARRMRALIAARHLMRATRLRKLANVHVLDIGAGDRKRHQVFGLAGGRARMAADAACVVDDLRPFDRGYLLGHNIVRSGFNAANYIMQERR